MMTQVDVITLSHREPKRAKNIVVSAIDAANGSKKQAAEALGISPRSLYNLIHRLDLWAALDRAARAHGWPWRAGRPRGPLHVAGSQDSA